MGMSVSSSTLAQAPTRQRGSAIRVIKYALFSASIVPSFVGAALAYHYAPQSFNLLYAVLAGLGLFLGQMAGDYFYYYGTHFHSDARDAHTKIFAGWKPLYTDAFLGDRGTLWAGIACLVLDLAIAVFFTWQLGYEVMMLAGLGAAVAIFFTPLMLKGYKEPVIFLTFGPLVMVGIFYVLTQQLAWAPIVVSLPLGFLITVVAYLKGARYELVSEGDQELILKLNRRVIVLLSAFAYLSLAAAVLSGFVPAWGLLAFLALPVSYSVLSVIRKGTSEVSAYLWAVVRAIAALVLVGAVLTLTFIYG